MTDVGDGLFDGMKQYKFMRAFFGIVVSSTIAVVVTLFTRPEPFARQRGLVWGTISDALEHYKGSPGSESGSRRTRAAPRRMEKELPRRDASILATVNLSREAADALKTVEGDLLYVSDRRWWLGGLRSTHAIVGQIDEKASGAVVEMGPQTWQAVVATSRADKPVLVERLY